MGACTLNVGGTPLVAELAKVSRSDLYGESRLKVLGPDGKLLIKAAVPEDGGSYIGRGDVRLLQKVDGSFSLAAAQLVDALTGKPREPVPSSFKEAPNFRPATADEISLMEVRSVYQLQAAEMKLKPGDMFLGHFNYRAGNEKNDAAIVVNAACAFLLVGNLTTPTFVGIEDDSQLIAPENPQEGEEGGEGDFASLL